MMGCVRLFPRGFRPLLLALSAVLLVGWFSPEISDPDFWWHLKTGQYIWQKHSLPVPDPFAYTTAMARPAYAGEERTRDFNLTHEWLAQALFYLIYRAAGFGGVVLFRAAVLTAFCALAGLLAWRRCGGFYGALAAAFATAGVASEFAVDRPYLVTFLLLASTIAILETRRWMWLLPPLFLIWANCHGGYFLGWVVVAAYSRRSALPGVAQGTSSRRPPPVDRRRGFRPGFGRQSQRLPHPSDPALLPEQLYDLAVVGMGPAASLASGGIRGAAVRRGGPAAVGAPQRTAGGLAALRWRSPWPRYRRNAIPS